MTDTNKAATGKRQIKALCDRAGTIAKRAASLSIALRDAGCVEDSRTMADIAEKATRVDGRLYRDFRS